VKNPPAADRTANVRNGSNRVALAVTQSLPVYIQLPCRNN